VAQRLAAGHSDVRTTRQHIRYRDDAGNLWDSWFDGNTGRWNLQKINNGGMTKGPGVHPGTKPMTIWVDPSNTQQHFAYLANDLAIYDAWRDGNSWHLEKIGAGGNTNGPAAAGTPFGCNFNQQQHIGYPDNAGNIWDSWYDGSGHWNLQKINNGGMTNGASAAGGVFIWVTGKEQHFTYSDGHGMIWDSFWRSDESSFSIAVNPTSIVATLNLDLHGPDTGSIQGPII
jgi:hypothetical protein